ncbi:lipin Ned1 [Batrachochytrium dendrobatidis]|nr:lipin Ned1 [Batrachochytrium dendrobatidis]KAK5672922.1 lipin Ned1 [Batrachochytrium dendrobatidis]
MTSIVTDIAGRVVSTISAVGSFYTEINPSTLSGAIDVVVVEQESGELVCSPFHVRFGKLKLLRPSEKVVELSVNGVPTHFAMKLGEAGEAFFVVKSENPVPSEYATSPIPTPSSPPDVGSDTFYLDPRSTSSSNALQDVPSVTSIPALTIKDPLESNKTPEHSAVSNISLGMASQPSAAKHGALQTDTASISITSPKPSVELIRESAELTFPKLPTAKSSEMGPKSSPISLFTSETKGVQHVDIPHTATHDHTLKVKDVSVSPPCCDHFSDVGAEYDTSRAIMGISPSNGWSWSWGDLPEKRPEQIAWGKVNATDSVLSRVDSLETSQILEPFVAGEEHLHVRASIPVLKSTYYSRNDRSAVPTVASNDATAPISIPYMSGSEKVDQYLASLPNPIENSPPLNPPFLQDATGKIGDEAMLASLVAALQITDKNSHKPTDVSQNDSSTPSSSPKTVTTMQMKEPLTASFIPRVEMSMCGNIKDLQAITPAAADAIFRKHAVSFDLFNTNPNVLLDPLAVFQLHGLYFTWSTIAPLIMANAMFGKPLTEEGLKKVIFNEKPLSSVASNAQRNATSTGRWSWWGRGAASTPTVGAVQNVSGVDTKRSNYASEKSRLAVDGNSVRSTSPTSEPALSPNTRAHDDKYRYAKSMRLTSNQLKSLNLKQGINTITFKVNSKLQGEAVCTSNLFLWHQNDKVVISDVDGTITKSDVLGHMFTMVGRDWTHAGVASLYTNIRRNGYKFLYLTSRAIGQANYTRDYLKKVEQDRFQLPEGPVIMSPDRLLRAFHREVILRKPEEFKIACLRDIKRLFGDRTPFYGGFGNRITDALSYRSVDVPQSRIFTVDPTGEVKLELMSNYRSSYLKLLDIVDQMFPPLTKSLESEYMDWSFWKNDISHVQIDIPGIAGKPGATSQELEDDHHEYENSDNDENPDDDDLEREHMELDEDGRREMLGRHGSKLQDQHDQEMILTHQESELLDAVKNTPF